MDGVPDDELIAFVYSDLSGLTRGRAFPARDFNQRLQSGIGWAPVNHAQSAFGVAGSDNPWGPIGDLRLSPDPATRIRVRIGADTAPLHMVQCDALEPNGAPWDPCLRTVLKRALALLEAETGLRLLVAFEYEFQLSGISRPAPAMSLEALRIAEPFPSRLMAALAEVGADPETFLPEDGPGQYEVTCRPALGLAAADRAVTVRELVRETARQQGDRATFAPLSAPGGVGNGLHVHFSMIDRDGKPVSYDPAGPGGMSAIAGHVAAGILDHLPALTALTAPSVTSYLRLKPGRMSSGFAILGERNREAALRIGPIDDRPGRDPASQFNLEYRVADGTAAPHLVLALIALAGLDGLRALKPAPRPVTIDPSTLSEGERRAQGIHPLPASLGEALAALAADTSLCGWLPPHLVRAFVTMKKAEMRLFDGVDPEEQCRRFRDVF